MVPHSRFPHLFSPISIKGVELRNRVAVTAHFAGWWVEQDGLPGDAFTAYVEERARGGVGLFVTGAMATRYDGGPSWFLNRDERIIPRYRAVTDAAHRHGCKVFAQLIHIGDPPQPEAQPAGVRPAVPRAATAPPVRPVVPPPPRTVEDLQDLVASFGRAAARVIAGGADGLELHAHEGFMHAQFLSPRWNTRTDRYGGSLENRARLIVETLEAMRAAAGPAVPLGLRLKAHDMAPGGMTLEDYIELVRRLERLGLVDYLSLTAGDLALHHGPMYRPDGEWLPLVAQVRAHSQLPIMHAGRITDPHLAEQALVTGQVDVVGLTKAHIADPHFTRKVAAGHLEDVRYCMRCLQSCIGKMETMTCVYNPLTGRERAWADLQPAPRRKRVVVVGAGPAGMEAALVAAWRGHDVVVLERAPRVGGQVRAAASSPLRSKFGEVAAYYERQAAKGPCDVRLGVLADAAAVVALQPDAVVVATGSQPRRLAVAVAGEGRSRPALTVLEAVAPDGLAATARRAAVVDREGHMRAFVVADLFSNRGLEVEFLTPFATPGPLIDFMNRGELCERLAERGVRFRPGTDVLWWQDATTLAVQDTFTGERSMLADIDLLVALAGSEPVAALAAELAGMAPELELHVIGDASAPRTVEEATVQGARVGRML
jgi:2,4-dienoyl-CoA reductase-like NADH-dependent reductase (Old Yellow Enzyme family)/NADPH-dependent 2,4-dienoyl-CoA reductase/sulfur reductase-like enzyme